TGLTNSLKRRLMEHRNNKGNLKTFTGRYCCYQLMYYEIYKYVNNAIARERQIKRWNRAKKMALITTMNPGMNNLNGQFITKDYG
ncbi:MAG: GIY-YIG nuclease family protein, partial [Saprospiraceae bacterium]|nr:GIY-YIG nuclease family protein [Saprospiraceae bacterium]